LTFKCCLRLFLRALKTAAAPPGTAASKPNFSIADAQKKFF